jgi:hypothetical protein
MRLSAGHIQAVINHLNKFAKTICPVCNHDEWTVSDTLFAFPEYEYRAPWTGPPFIRGTEGLREPATAFNLESDPQVFPVVPVTCVTCGYVFLLSAIKLSLVPGSR